MEKIINFYIYNLAEIGYIINQIYRNNLEIIFQGLMMPYIIFKQLVHVFDVTMILRENIFSGYTSLKIAYFQGLNYFLKPVK